MAFFIVIIGLLQAVAGVMFFVAAKSAIHEILGTLSFGMGILSITLGIAVNHLAVIRRNAEAQLRIFSDRLKAPQ